MINAKLIAEARERAHMYTGGPEADRLWRLADALERREKELADWEEHGAPAWVEAKYREIANAWDEGYSRALRDHDCNGRSEQTRNPYA